ncbi:hypothetical protein, partial [Klebsiella pneumoniae]|uniref:hypothetical protein n=1 Tax=Klebsiella pneumoniae TaxID=573 RepID=UPI0040557D49
GNSKGQNSNQKKMRLGTGLGISGSEPLEGCTKCGNPPKKTADKLPQNKSFKRIKDQWWLNCHKYKKYRKDHWWQNCHK